MSYHNDMNPIVVIGGVIFVALLLSGGIARTLGADIAIVFVAVLYSCVMFALVCGVCWWIGHHLDISFLLTGSALLVLVWPFWWKVLDSIAAGDSAKTSLIGSFFSQRESYSPFPDFGPPVEWYNASMFKWGIEIALFCLLAFCIWRNRRYS